MNRTLSRLACGAFAAIALLAVACGGGGGGGLLGGSGSSSSSLSSADFNKDLFTFVRGYFTTNYRMLTGEATTAELLRLWDDSCRKQVAAGDLEKFLKGPNSLPKFEKHKIDDVDFEGKAKVTKTDEGVTVTVPAYKDSSIRVDGKWLNAFEFLKSMDFFEDDFEDETLDIGVLLINGRYYENDEDCSLLSAMAEQGREGSATPTPEPRRGATPTPAPRTASAATPTPGRGATASTPAPRTGTTSGSSTSDVEAFAKRYWIMEFTAHAGGALKAEDVLAFHGTNCQAGATAADVNKGFTKLSNLYPKMKGAKIEDIDFGGKLKITQTERGYSTEYRSNNVRLKVNGSFVNLHTWGQSVGYEPPAFTGNEPLTRTFVMQNGKLVNSDCLFFILLLL